MVDLVSVLSSPAFDAKKLAVTNSQNPSELRSKCQQCRAKVSQHKIDLIVRHHNTLISSVVQVEEISSQLQSLRHHLERSKTCLTSLHSVTSTELQESEQTQLPSFRAAASSLSGSAIRSTNESYLQAKVGLEHQEWRWVVQLSDELEVCLYEKRFDEAVALICKLRVFNEEFKSDLVAQQQQSPLAGTSGVPYLRLVLDNALNFVNSKLSFVMQSLITEVLSDSVGMNSIGHGERTGEGNSPIRSSRDCVRSNPVSLLLALGFPSQACDAFLQRHSEIVNQLCSDMLASASTLDPESCLMDYGQKVFRTVLETYRTFLLQFSCRPESSTRVGGDQSTSKGVGGVQRAEPDASHRTRSEGVVDFVLPRLLMWVKSALHVFCDHFVRLSVPGYRPVIANAMRNDFDNTNTELAEISMSNIEQGLSHDGNGGEHDHRGVDGNGNKTGNDESGDRVTSAPPLPTEVDLDSVGGVHLSVPLLSEEWRVLGSNLKWVMRLSRRLEKDYLAMGFSLGNELAIPLKACISAAFARVDRQIKLCIQQEKWELERLRIGTAVAKHQPQSPGQSESGANAVVMASSSVHVLYDLMQETIRNVRRILSPNYSTTEYIQTAVVNETIHAMRIYVDRVIHAAAAYELLIPSDDRKKKSKGGSPLKSKTAHQADFELEARRLITKEKLQYPAIAAAMAERCKRELDVKEKRVLAVLCSQPFNVAQSLTQIANVICIGTDLVSRVQSTYEKTLKSRLFSFDAFQSSLLDLNPMRPSAVTKLCRTLARRAAYNLSNSESYQSAHSKQDRERLVQQHVNQLQTECEQLLSVEHGRLLGGLFENYLSVA